MSKKNFSGKKLIKGLLIGSIVGGSAALLLAPRSGKETREKITKEIDNNLKLITDFKDDVEAVKTNASHLQDLTDTLIPEFISGTDKSMRAFEFKAKHRLSNIKKQFEKINSEISQLENEWQE